MSDYYFETGIMNDYYFGPFVGFRTWGLKEPDQLNGVFFATPWVSGVNKSECNVHCKRRADAIGHKCGFHSWRELKDIFAVRSTICHTIAGVTLNWGECYLHKSGIRSEYSKIIAIYDRCLLNTRLQQPIYGFTSPVVAENYQVPLLTYQEIKELAKKYYMMPDF